MSGAIPVKALCAIPLLLLAAPAAASSVRFGDIYQEILAHADNIGADLVIVASHKPDIGDDLPGTTASRSVRHASCSVLVIRQSG